MMTLILTAVLTIFLLSIAALSSLLLLALLAMSER